VGFLAGLTYAPRLPFFEGQPGWILLLIALAAGVVGALLSLVLQRFAVALAGFFVGGYAINSFLVILGLDTGQLSSITFVIGGIVGAVLVSFLFDWALILLSSLIGATLVTQSFNLSEPVSLGLFLLLLVAGIAVQVGIKMREPEETVAPAA
jgi:hypothetical protein